MSRGLGTKERLILDYLDQKNGFYLRDMLPQGYTGVEYQSLWRAVQSLERKGKVLTKRTWIYKPECRNKDLRVVLIEALQRLKSGIYGHHKKES